MPGPRKRARQPDAKGRPSFAGRMPDFDPQVLGKTILDIRHTLGLTQAQLCERSGLSDATLRRLEGGRLPAVSFDTLCRLAGAFGVPVQRLIRDCATAGRDAG
jgi:DNA-binding Xre family transcriptional regulator